MNIPITLSRDDLYLVNEAANNYLYGPSFHVVKKDVSPKERAWFEDFDENDADYLKVRRETYWYVTWFDLENGRPRREPVFVTFSAPKRALELYLRMFDAWIRESEADDGHDMKVISGVPIEKQRKAFERFRNAVETALGKTKKEKSMKMKNCRFWVWSLGLSLLFTLPAFCAEEEAGFEPENPTFAEAMNLWQGNGVEKDIPRAVELFERAAGEDHHVESMKMLSWIYSQGDGVAVDERKIRKYIKMAAEAGDTDCQFAMGEVLLSDKDPAKKKKCVPWFERAAEQNHPEAQRTLGIFCSTGKYLPKDDEKAVYWFQKAADQNDGQAQLMLGLALRDGVGTPKDEKKAFSHFLRSAHTGNAEARYHVAVCYINGTGTPRNTQKAETYLRQAAQQGFAPAIELMEKSGLELSE